MKKTGIKRFLSITGSILITLVFALSAAVFVIAVSTKGSGVPNIFGVSFLRVTTGSMAPVYSVGDLIFAKEVDAGALAVGDIISFYSDDPTIKDIPNTHRIAEIIKNDDGSLSFITKGDANSEKDEYPVSADRIIGRVEGKIYGVNRIINFFQSDFKFFIFLLVPVIVIAALEVKNFFRVVNQKDDGGDEKETDEKPACDEGNEQTDNKE